MEEKKLVQSAKTEPLTWPEMSLQEPNEEGRWPLDYAESVAGWIVEQLESVCEKIVVAGSIRRRRPFVKDIEIVCVPKLVWSTNLLDEKKSESVFEMLMEWLLICDYQVDGQVVKGGVFAKRSGMDGRFTYGLKNKLLIHRPTGVAVDLFTADEENWGMSLLVRTGSADFNKAVMARFRRLGMRGHAYGGVTDARGKTVECPEEEEVFQLLRVPFIEPELRVGFASLPGSNLVP